MSPTYGLSVFLLQAFPSHTIFQLSYAKYGSTYAPPDSVELEKEFNLWCNLDTPLFKQRRMQFFVRFEQKTTEPIFVQITSLTSTIERLAPTTTTIWTSEGTQWRSSYFSTSNIDQSQYFIFLDSTAEKNGRWPVHHHGQGLEAELRRHVLLAGEGRSVGPGTQGFWGKAFTKQLSYELLTYLEPIASVGYPW